MYPGDNICKITYEMPKYEFETLVNNESFEEFLYDRLSEELAEFIRSKLKVAVDLKPYPINPYEETIRFSGDLAILQVEEYKELLEATKLLENLLDGRIVRC